MKNTLVHTKRGSQAQTTTHNLNSWSVNALLLLVAELVLSIRRMDGRANKAVEVQYRICKDGVSMGSKDVKKSCKYTWVSMFHFMCQVFWKHTIYLVLYRLVQVQECFHTFVSVLRCNFAKYITVSSSVHHVVITKVGRPLPLLTTDL